MQGNNCQEPSTSTKGEALLEVERAVARACSAVLGTVIAPGDDFLAMGGDSLAALAVSKRLVELGGGSWPNDGIIHGRLAACELV